MLQRVIWMQKENPIPPSSIIKLEKDNMIRFECVLTSWKSQVDLVKSLLDQASDLAKECGTLAWTFLKNGELDKLRNILIPLSP